MPRMPSLPFADGAAQHPFKFASLPLAADGAVRRHPPALSLISIEFVTVCAIVEREEEEEEGRRADGRRAAPLYPRSTWMMLDGAYSDGRTRGGERERGREREGWRDANYLQAAAAIGGAEVSHSPQCRMWHGFG